MATYKIENTYKDYFKNYLPTVLGSKHKKARKKRAQAKIKKRRRK